MAFDVVLTRCLALVLALARPQPGGVMADSEGMQLEPHKLDVYVAALDLHDELEAIQEAYPPGRAHLRDQLDRGGTSVVLNIAEGAGEFRKDEKQRFYRMARRSATETAAIIDILERRRIIGAERASAVREILVRVIAMLTRLVTS